MNKYLKLVTAFFLLMLAGASVSAYGAATPERNVKSLDQYTAAKLENAQKEMKDGKYAEALSDLQDLEKSVQDKPYALALTEQMISYVYIEQKKYKKALPYLRKAVDLNALPEQSQHQAIMSLAQMYALTEQYAKTIDLLEGWFKKEKKPPASAFMLAANAHYQLKQLPESRKFVKLAIQKSDEPHEQWYSLLVGVDYSLKKFDEAIDVLRKMITYWPDNASYWHDLYGLYLLQNKEEEALVVGRVAYSKGLITDGDDMLNLARLEILHGMPYYGAKVLEKGMQSGAIKDNLDNLQLLVTAWEQARETDKALKTLDKAAAMSDDGTLYLKKAQLCYGDGNWDCTIDAAKHAAAKGGLKEPGKAYLFRGMALMQTKKYDQAKEQFKKAEKYKGSKERARNLIKYVDSTIAATT